MDNIKTIKRQENRAKAAKMRARKAKIMALIAEGLKQP